MFTAVVLAVALSATGLDLVVINGTGETIVADVCCEGYPYLEPCVIAHGQAATWTWRRGHTTVTDGRRLWGPKMRAVRGKRGEIIVVLTK